MLEVDEDSRLGRELIAGGTRYHAHFVPDEGATADFYQQACETLTAAGIEQYEISNFARSGAKSRHNLKYWTRQHYLGFGVDAHSMLSAESRRPSGAEAFIEHSFSDTAEAVSFPKPARAFLDIEAVRFATPNSLDAFMNRAAGTVTPVSEHAALEESFFLGLRLNCGVDLEQICAQFGAENVASCESVIEECVVEGLLEKRGTVVRLSARGRLLSNEVFARFLAPVE
jgi:oxygen-independent coproporphyrinogen-3 oxidase